MKAFASRGLVVFRDLESYLIWWWNLENLLCGNINRSVHIKTKWIYFSPDYVTHDYLWNYGRFKKFWRSVGTTEQTRIKILLVFEY